jgi:hypothetical protein
MQGTVTTVLQAVSKPSLPFTCNCGKALAASVSIVKGAWPSLVAALAPSEPSTSSKESAKASAACMHGGNQQQSSKTISSIRRTYTAKVPTPSFQGYVPKSEATGLAGASESLYLSRMMMAPQEVVVVSSR